MNGQAPRQCAAKLLDTSHLMMRTIRPEPHKAPYPGLSMQQFRAMMMIRDRDGFSVSDLARKTGSTLSAASKLVDGLVTKGLVSRGPAPDDRRRLVLSLTSNGKQVVETARLEVVEALAERLKTLSPNELAILDVAMDVLRAALTEEGRAAGKSAGRDTKGNHEKA